MVRYLVYVQPTLTHFLFVFHLLLFWPYCVVKMENEEFDFYSRFVIRCGTSPCNLSLDLINVHCFIKNACKDVQENCSVKDEVENRDNVEQWKRNKHKQDGVMMPF
ncbi:sequence-specific DNA binding [Striga asiatica]|uniref:Sequence-specific DNA binding n=1 Tax=Striga asiatica TaxID=4170 RepID=A0A5A7QM02_STRAF|nr:sequence-specific DNA binding [Striga asiatica]